MLTLLICLSGFILLTKAFENVDVSETDTITLVCPRIASSLNVTHTDGHSEWYADFKPDNCATYQNMKCAQDAEANRLIVPVSNITRTIASYSCGGRAYRVKFYAVPKGVKCRKPKLTESGTLVSISCTANKIYPQLQCYLQDTINNLTYTDVRYERLQSFGKPVYYRETCTFFLEISKLSLGVHKLQVNVQPKDVAGAGQVQIISPNVKLGPIKTKLEAPCPRGPSVQNGYIEAGKDAYCVCLKQGNSFGTVYFSNESSGHSIKGSLASSANVSVSYPKDHDQTFYCRASPLEDNPVATKFKAVFAFGPDILHLSKPSIRMELCSNTTLTASVLSDAVNPGARFECSADNPKALRISQAQEATSNFSSSFVLEALLPGKFPLTCRGTNVIFKDVHAEAHIVVVVEASRSVQPKITMNRGNTLRESASAESVIITCSVGEVSNLTFSCFNQTLMQTTQSISIAHNLTREDNSRICSCTSEYSCYKKKMVETPIYLAYGPGEIKVSPTAVKMDLCKDVTITVSVPESEAFPGINFNMSVDVPNSLSWEQASANFTATFTVKAQRAGEFNLTITASNAYDENIRVESTVRVFVQDSKRFKPVLLINNGSTTIEGSSTQDVLIRCRAPLPGNISSISLSCLGTNVTSGGAELLIYKNLSRSQNGEKCHCQVWYDPYCDYIETASAAINVTYAASISSFYANSNKTTIEVDEGENITLVCVVASNPKPDIRVQTESVMDYISERIYTAAIEESHRDTWKFVYEIQNVACKHSSTYSCLARNSLTHVDVRQSVTVAVRCEVQLLGPSNLEFEVNSGRIATASADLLGYPKPNNFTVFSPGRGQLIDGKDFSVLYQETTFFSGKLIVIMDTLKEDKLAAYTYAVNVTNGIGNDLQFVFSLVPAGNKVLIDATTLTIVVAVAGIAAVSIVVIVLCCKRKQRNSGENRGDHLKQKSKERSFSASRYVKGLFFNKKKKKDSQEDQETAYRGSDEEERTDVDISAVELQDILEDNEDSQTYYDEPDERVPMRHPKPNPPPKKKAKETSLTAPLLPPFKKKAQETLVTFSNKRTSKGKSQSGGVSIKPESAQIVSKNQPRTKVPLVTVVKVSKDAAQSAKVNETSGTNNPKSKVSSIDSKLKKRRSKSYGDLKMLGDAPPAPNFRTEKQPSDASQAQDRAQYYENMRINEGGPPSINSVANENYISDTDVVEMKESCQAIVGSQDVDPKKAAHKTVANSEIPSQGEDPEHTNPKTLANLHDNDPHQTRPKTLAISPKRPQVPKDRYSKMSVQSPTSGTPSVKIEEEQRDSEEKK